jgi:hypothetical protein
MQTHCEVTAVQTGGNATAIVRKQLSGQRENTQNARDVFCAVRVGTRAG